MTWGWRGTPAPMGTRGASWIYLAGWRSGCFVVLPVSEAVLMWGAAPVLGVPLVLLFNNIGLDPIVALAGMSVIWPLGDALPPTAIIGRLTVDVVGYRDRYTQFLKACVVPGIIIMVVGTLMVIYSSRLTFLTGL